MNKLNLKNKVIFNSFFITVTFVSVFSWFYYAFNFKENIELGLGIGFVMLLIMNIFFVVLINDLIIKDIEKLKTKVKKVKSGTLSERFDTKRTDEIGELYNEISSVVKNQYEIISKVKDSSRKMDESSKNLQLLIIENKEVVDDLTKSLFLVNEGTSNQIKGIEDIEYSIEEMAMGIKRINYTILEVVENANNTVSQSKKGNSSLEKAFNKMSEMKGTIEESMSTMRLLGIQIKEIQKIVDIIRSISSRTNLLALNATIEAERAGENGEGFIVIADEIKDLATKSTESTMRIEKITRNIMERQEKAIEQIERNGKETVLGLDVVSEANKAFNEILRSTNDIGQQLNEVSATSEQLNVNTNSIVDSVEKTSSVSKIFSRSTSNVDTVVEQQTNSIQKLVQSIEALNELTEEINEFISKYNR